MGRQYYSTIDKADLKIFIMAQLQLAMLSAYEQKMRKLIHHPFNKGTETLNLFFNPLKTTAAIPDALKQSCDTVSARFEAAILHRRKQIPSMPSENIKFTEHEISGLLDESLLLVKTLVQKRGMEEYVFRQFGVKVGDYNELN